jgi:hypothetical protein
LQGLQLADIHKVNSRTAKSESVHSTDGETHGVTAQTQDLLPTLSITAGEPVDRKDQFDITWLGELLLDRPFESVFLVYPKLG